MSSMDVQLSVGAVENRRHLSHYEFSVSVSFRLIVDRRRVCLFFNSRYARLDPNEPHVARRAARIARRPTISVLAIFRPQAGELVGTVPVRVFHLKQAPHPSRIWS